jgi:hypothetical protein
MIVVQQSAETTPPAAVVPESLLETGTTRSGVVVRGGSTNYLAKLAIAMDY